MATRFASHDCIRFREKIGGSAAGALLRRGFTTVELVAALSVVAVATTLAIPAFSAYAANLRATATANDLLRDLAMARFESVRSGYRTAVRPLNGSWQSGWEVVRTAGVGPTSLIASHPLEAGSVILQLCSANVDASDGVGFGPSGALAELAEPVTLMVQAGAVRFRQLRLLQIAPAGGAQIVRLQEPAC